jgi:hypothetical protein
VGATVGVSVGLAVAVGLAVNVGKGAFVGVAVFVGWNGILPVLQALVANAKATQRTGSKHLVIIGLFIFLPSP